MKKQKMIYTHDNRLIYEKDKHPKVIKKRTWGFNKKEGCHELNTGEDVFYHIDDQVPEYDEFIEYYPGHREYYKNVRKRVNKDGTSYIPRATNQYEPETYGLYKTKEKLKQLKKAFLLISLGIFGGFIFWFFATFR